MKDVLNFQKSDSIAQWYLESMLYPFQLQLHHGPMKLGVYINLAIQIELYIDVERHRNTTETKFYWNRIIIPL